MTQSTNDNIHKNGNKQFKIVAESSVSDCGCSTTSCSAESSTDRDTNTKRIHMSVTIDGQVIESTPFDNNIVDVAKRAKIGIPAPCYRNQRSKGCCSACVVDIDGEQKFACATVPENGMNIIVDRADLKAIRKQRLLEYKDGIKSGNPCECSLPGAVDCCK